jgi:zinc transport system ATP-binding protein
MDIKISKLSYSYGNNAKALENISLQIDKGDFAALIGTNGSGKTTLIKLILGLLEKQQGKIELFGQDISKFEDWNLIGYVPQKYSIDRNFPASVDELLSLKGKANKQDIIKKLGISSILEKRFAELSGGQQQRVLIALCLMTEPKLLILDEPTVGVDIKAQHDFYELLKKLNETDNLTIILITHDIGLVSTHVKKVICLNGKVCKTGKPREAQRLIKETYGDKFNVHHHH